MIAKMIDGVTRVLGKAQGYIPLPIRDEEGPTMVSSWEPTPAELALLNEGGHVYIRIRGTVHPPIGVGVQGAGV